MYYKWIEDKDFEKTLLSKREIKENDTSRPDKRCLKNHQYLASNYINPQSPYGSLLLYFQTGTGKTLAAISIIDNFIRNDENTKAILLTKNEDLATTFKNQLFSTCSRYTSKEEKDILLTGSPEEKNILLKKLEQKISRNYTFYNQGEFKKKVEKNQIKNFTNKIVVIDEFHNMIGNSGYEFLMKIIQNSKNFKLILMSATPVYDRVQDAFQVSNLLNKGKNKLPISSKELSEKGYMSKNTNIEKISIFKDRDIYRLTETGLNILKKAFRGKVIYLKTNIENFPSYSNEGKYIEISGYVSPVKVVKCEMSDFQESRYLKIYEATKKNSDFNKTLEYASSIIYPDINGKISIGGFGFENYIDKGKTSFLKEESLKKYSTKLYSLLKNIQKSKGKVFIFSNYISDDGIGLIKACLLVNGISSFRILTSSISSKERINIVDRFNSPANDRAEDIKIIITSKVVSEGITFKNVRELHIYEPSWNFSSIDQITGRVIRNNSHSRLPLSERNVKIFRYCAIPSNISLSSDASKYIKAGRKDVYIKEFERMIEKSSFSCELFKSVNVNKNLKDYSRECSYSECDYSCDFKKTNEKDSSTYDVFYHNKELYYEIASNVKILFKKTSVWSLEDISKKLNLDQESVSSIMKHIKNPKILTKGNFYILKKEEKVKNKRYLEEEFFKTKKINIKGVYKDSDFKLYLEGKKIPKSCKAFSLDELRSFVQLLGETVPVRATKSSLCSILQKKLLGAPR